MIKHLFVFCVSIPIVLPLNVDSVLSHKSLRIVLDHCIAASKEVHYIRLYHSISVSVYNVLLVLFLSLCLTMAYFEFTFGFGFEIGSSSLAQAGSAMALLTVRKALSFAIFLI